MLLAAETFKPSVRMAARAPLAMLLMTIMTGCQSGPASRSGMLSSYEGLLAPGEPIAKRTYRRRDDAASDAVARVFIEPAILAPSLQSVLASEERLMVLREVDRQICFEISERFPIADSLGPDVARIRTVIVDIDASDRTASVASAASSFFIPVPFLRLRIPGGTGGLAAESELLGPNGQQIAAIALRRMAQIVGRTRPSLSRAGDALQMAEPLGDALGTSFSTKKRQKIRFETSDPCRHFGPRQNAKHSLGNALVGRATGLYVPQVAGTGGLSRD